MKPTSPSDFQRSEKTDPGAAASADSPADDEPEDEFPSEATRIDPGPNASPPAPARKAPPRASAPGGSAPASGALDGQNAKIAALRSLSSDAPSTPESRRLPPQPRQSSGGGSKLPWILLVGVLGFVGYSQWHGRNSGGGTGGGGGTSGKTEIRTEVVSPTGGTGQTHMAAGYTAALDPIAVGVPGGGRVKEVKVQNGDKVKRNQVIVLLDDSSYLAEMSLAHAEVANAEQQLAQTRMLFKAQAATSIDVSRRQGELSIARAKLRPIQQRIDQSKIRAPVDSTVLDVLLRPGESVAPNAAVIKLADLSRLVAEVDINESDIIKIRRDQPVEVTSDAFADKRYKGKVHEISGQVDKAKGTFLVRVALEVPDLSLRPGMSVKCSFQPVEGEKPRIYISRSSLTADGSVWVVGSDRRVARRPVTTQAATGTSVEVLTGLSAGDKIVVDASQVHDNQVL